MTTEIKIKFCSLSGLSQIVVNFVFQEAVAQTCSVKKVFLEISQNSQENTCARDSFLMKLQCNFIKKEALAQVFSCEFCEISKNTFLYRTTLVAASVFLLLSFFRFILMSYRNISQFFESPDTPLETTFVSSEKIATGVLHQV